LNKSCSDPEEIEQLLYRELEYARRQGNLKLVRQLEESLRGDRPPRPRLAVDNRRPNGMNPGAPNGAAVRKSSS